VKRGQILDPVRQAFFVRRLRDEDYPCVVHVHPSTATLGAYLAGRSRAPVRVGCLREQGNLHFTATVPRPTSRHKVERMNEYLGHLGLPTGQVRSLRVSDGERATAEGLLAQSGAGEARERVALFLSGRGRKGKDWSLGCFAAIVAGLRERGFQPVVILGPEELRQESRIRTALGAAHYFKQLPIRTVAALVASCRLAVVPDSGPMHLAIAVRTPTVGLFRTPTAEDWGPRAGQGAWVIDEAGEDAPAVLAAVDDLRART
jgi:ADP-heptose:LPS heptosyltransferase